MIMRVPAPVVLLHLLFYLLTFFMYLFAEKLLVLLRDGRKLLGILRSFDQFGTIVCISVIDLDFMSFLVVS